MAKPSNHLPGVTGKYETPKESIGIQLGHEYKVLIQKRLEDIKKVSGVEMTVQEAIKLAVAYFFPVDGFERSTQIYVEEILGNIHTGLAPSKEVNPEDLKMKLSEPTKFKPKDEDVYERRHAAIEQVMAPTNGRRVVIQKAAN